MKIKDGCILEYNKKEEEKFRYPNLNTVLMVEEFLEKRSDKPIQLNELSKKLPRRVMVNTLKVILEYLWVSGKIIYGPKGVQWIYSAPEHLKSMLNDSMEI